MQQCTYCLLMHRYHQYLPQNKGLKWGLRMSTQSQSADWVKQLRTSHIFEPPTQDGQTNFQQYCFEKAGNITWRGIVSQEHTSFVGFVASLQTRQKAFKSQRWERAALKQGLQGKTERFYSWTQAQLHLSAEDLHRFTPSTLLQELERERPSSSESGLCLVPHSPEDGPKPMCMEQALIWLSEL